MCDICNTIEKSLKVDNPFFVKNKLGIFIADKEYRIKG